MISIVMAADVNSAVYHAINGGWTTTDHLLATMSEQQAGIVSLQQRLTRPGVTDTRPMRFPSLRDPKTKKLTFDSMTIAEYEARLKARLEGA